MTDISKAEKGVWIPYDAGIELCIASTGSVEFRKARSKLLKPHIRQIRSKTLSSDDILNILKPAYAKHVLVDWKNIEDEKGEAIPYSYQKALEFFNNPALSPLLDFVLESAGEEDLFRVDDIEDAEKNL